MADQYYRFFPGDYQRDTGDLTLVEHGAYRVLLDHYYTQECLPADKEKCYRIARAFTQAEQTAVDTITARFFRIDGERLRNRKADQEIIERKAFIDAQSKRGKAGAEARWSKAQKEAEVKAQAMRKHKHKDNQPSPSPSPSPIIKEESINTLSSFSGEKPPSKNGTCPQKEIIEIYHEVLPMMPRVQEWPEANQKILRTRWREKPERQNLEWWQSYFTYIKESQFLTGKEKDWTANLEWIVRPKNMTKILNGNYHRQKHGGIREWLNQTESNLQP